MQGDIMSTNEPPADTDGLPPGVESNWAMMDSGAFVARMYAERQRQSYLIAALTALNLGTPACLLAPGPLPENHPFYTLVGRVASEWSHLEHIVDLTIWKLLGVDNRLAACLTSQYPGLSQRCNAVCSLGIAKGLTREQLKPFRKLRSDASDDADWRARWVHDPWFIQEGTQAAQFRAMPEVDPRFGLQVVSEDEINRTIGEIRALQQQARDAQKSVFDALAALPEKPA
jgi:hypothetical protein